MVEALRNQAGVDVPANRIQSVRAGDTIGEHTVEFSGPGERMMEQLIDVAHARGLGAMVGHVLAENRGMLALCQKLGFSVGDSSEGPMVKRVTLALAAA
jgi:L-amino acid N-acyltransferase YncA